MGHSKKLTIITINLNDRIGLIKTIKSVLTQSFTDFEYIIIDGASSDGSLEIIKEYSDKLAYWISEPDGGLYDAMNKGIMHASGLYCMFLNSGDFLSGPGILEKCFNRHFSEDILYCNIILDDGHSLINKKFPKELTFKDFFVDSIGHPSTFIRRELFNKIGFLNEKLKIVSDWEFFLKAIFIYRCTTLYLDEYLVVFNTSGISSRSVELMLKERSFVLQELFPRFIPDYEKLILISGYTHIHSRNKNIRKFADLVNHILALYHRKKAKNRIVFDQ